MTAVGVKGLLMRRRASFVVCALSKVELSRRTCRGFGGLGGSWVDESAEAFGAREARNWATRARWVCARCMSVCEEDMASECVGV